MPETDLASLKNLGPESVRLLHSIEVYTRDDLEQMGSLLTYKILKHRFPKSVNLIMLYALEGALRNLHWNGLPPELKAQLKLDAAGDLDIQYGSSAS